MDTGTGQTDARLSAWVNRVTAMDDATRETYLADYYRQAADAQCGPWGNARMHTVAFDNAITADIVTESSDDDDGGKVGAFFDALRDWQTANMVRFDLVSFISGMSSVDRNTKTGRPDMTTLGAQLGVTRQTALYKYKTYTAKYADTVKAIARECGIAPTLF